MSHGDEKKEERAITSMSIVKVEADYYLVNSTFSYFPGLPVWHSKDLKNWKQIGNVISRTSQMDFLGEHMTRGLFAPGISYYKGTFCSMTAVASALDCLAIDFILWVRSEFVHTFVCTRGVTH